MERRDTAYHCHIIIITPTPSGIRAVRRFVSLNCGAGAVKNPDSWTQIQKAPPLGSRTFFFFFLHTLIRNWGKFL